MTTSNTSQFTGPAAAPVSAPARRRDLSPAGTKPATMRAMVYRRYGPPHVVAMVEVPRPVPKANEVLIRIRATTVTSSDWRARSLSVPPGFGLFARFAFGVFRPRKPILGTELAGEIAAIGRNVTRFRVGDEVIALTGADYGCHAEYRTLAEDGLIAAKPANMSVDEAATLSFGGTTALTFLRDKGKVRAGERVVVVGASGGVGTAAVQLAKHFGADVTGVCSKANAELVRSIGADRVIDYRTEDFAATPAAYDIILDTTGTATFARCDAALRAGGRLLAVMSSFAATVGIGGPWKASGKKLIAGVSAPTADDVRFLAGLAAAGQLRAVIDRRYPLEAAREAHAYVAAGHKRGNVVLTVRG